MRVDFDHYCLNKYKSGYPEGCQWCGRGSIWGNTFRTTYAGGTLHRGEAVMAHEHWLAQPEQAHLLRRIDDLRGKQLVCVCSPKLCHTNVLAFLANSNRATRIRWWTFMRGLNGPRTIVTRDAWDAFVCK